MKHLWKIDHQRKSFSLYQFHTQNTVPSVNSSTCTWKGGLSHSGHTSCSVLDITHAVTSHGLHWRLRQQQGLNSQACIDKTGSYNGATSLGTLTLFSVKSGSKRLESGSTSALHKPTFHFPFQARKLDIKWPRKPKLEENWKPIAVAPISSLQVRETRSAMINQHMKLNPKSFKGCCPTGCNSQLMRHTGAQILC